MRVLVLVSLVFGYGRDGHWLSGRIAQEFLSPEALALANQLVPAHNGQLSLDTTWADGCFPNQKSEVILRIAGPTVSTISTRRTMIPRVSARISPAPTVRTTFVPLAQSTISLLCCLNLMINGRESMLSGF
jgi:hypothetical protein